MQLSRLRLVLLFLLVACCRAAVAADSVVGMCTDMRRAEDLCVCAAQKLKQETGDDAYALYEEVGKEYREALGYGVARADSWDAAVRAAAERRGASFAVTLTETNRLGAAHRKAMQGCQ